ncbi:Cystatin-2 [Varanus komodoensis]|uniref:Cystatin C n=1 Tax=Varanus komodoensis TaxID=61221 RepID=A0A8D2IVY7_VARKO|nr:cystatin-like [Varanus komodoensis]KAF7240450.1 Cystatin-2 [Varanus komodoensis]
MAPSASPWLRLLVFAAVLCAAALTRAQRRLGAPEEASADDQDVRDALRFAMKEYNRGSNDMYASRVSEVISVKRQLVSGVKYIIVTGVGRTTCTKAVADVENCAFHTAPGLAKHMTCTFEVYTVPWQNKISLLRTSCN